MLKFRNIIIANILIMLVVGIVLWGKKKQISKKPSDFDDQLLLKDLETLQYRWEMGDFDNALLDNKLKCPSFSMDEIDPAILKCQPEYFSCFLKSKINNLTGLKLNRIIQKGSRSISAEFSYQDKKLQLNFNDICRDVYLPKKVYVSGPKEKNELIWDNFSYSVFVDRFLVTQFEVNQWARSINREDLINDERYSLLKPARNVTRKDQIQFCLSIGKQLLQSHILDAASFYNTTVGEGIDQRNYKSHLPWTRRNIRLETSNLTDKDCARLFSRECEIYGYVYHNTRNTSWIGIHQVLGGDLEHVINTVDPKDNLKASNMSLARKSTFHAVGQRMYWDGVSFEKEMLIKNNNLTYLETKDDKTNIGFRCMTYAP